MQPCEFKFPVPSKSEHVRSSALNRPDEWSEAHRVSNAVKMGSSNRKKKEKAKDFQVSLRWLLPKGSDSDRTIETQVEGRQNKSQGLQLYGHEFSVEM